MSEPTREERKLRKRNPHPTAGWLCAMPIPDPDGEAEEDATTHRLGPFTILGIRSRGVGIRSGVVLEVGPAPDGHDYEPFAQDAAGRTVYYAEGSFVEVDGYHFLGVGQVICWDPSPAEEDGS